MEATPQPASASDAADPRDAATLAVPPILWLLFFISGAAGLMYEVVWVRALGIRFGATAPAIGTVLAAFIAAPASPAGPGPLWA
jgi:hypothetical protein